MSAIQSYYFDVTMSAGVEPPPRQEGRSMNVLGYWSEGDGHLHTWKPDDPNALLQPDVRYHSKQGPVTTVWLTC